MTYFKGTITTLFVTEGYHKESVMTASLQDEI